jgi:hypothetical protein
VIKKENKWWVDLKYLFGHDRSDTTKAAVSEGPSKENP